MQFGCCAKIEQAQAVYSAGFDYLEAGVTSLVPDEGNNAFAPILAQYQASPVPVQAFNLFLPKDLKIVGPDVNEERAKTYVMRAVERMEKIGATTAVIGSGGSRSVPDGFSRDEAIQQIVYFLGLVADETDHSSITIAIEPLNKKESNIINSVAEGVSFAKEVNRPSIRVLADFYHMDEDNEPLETLVENKEWLVHIHVADTGRGSPGTGQYPYTQFVDLLSQAGYDGMVSIECRWNDFESEAEPSVAFLRQVFGQI
ncbi:MAG: sugar phosphate isomerase/epimerase family protein [Chloroflexota bacterium]